MQPLGSQSAKNGNFHGAFYEAPSKCEETGGRMRVGGPLWGAPIHKSEVVSELLRRFAWNLKAAPPASGDAQANAAVCEDDAPTPAPSVTAALPSPPSSSSVNTATAEITSSDVCLLPYPVPTQKRLAGLIGVIAEELQVSSASASTAFQTEID